MEDKDQILISKECTEIIVEQMKNSICKIIKKDKKFGTGFFCQIPYKNKSLKVLITSYQILIKQEIKNINDITLDDDKIEYNLHLDTNRIICSSKTDDITIIELKEKESQNFKFLELDNIQDIDVKNYENKTCYIIQYIKTGKICSFYGKIKTIDNNEIKYECPLDKNSYGFPILNATNNKIIGIHRKNNNKYCFGTNLNFMIKEYIKRISKRDIKNEIEIILDIKRDDLEKNIYFLDNTDFHNNLKELNELTSKLNCKSLYIIN